MTPSIEKRFYRTIDEHNLLPPDVSLVAGVSGGPDSICLLHLLSRNFPGQTAACIYVDHLLRPDETRIEKKLVEKLCGQLDISFSSCEIDVPAEISKSGESPEACARTLRYQALDEARIQAGAELIAVGHTRDDQVEEVLIRLIRGSGLKGLSGMDYRNGRIIRPLLDTSKSEVLAYLALHRLAFCDDSSNRSRRFLRNRIRAELLPLLERDFNPAIRQTLVNTSHVLKAEERYLSAETKRVYDGVVAVSQASPESGNPADHTLQIAAFSLLHPALQRRVVERLCWKMGCRPTFSMIHRIVRIATTDVTGTEIHLPDGIRAFRQTDNLLFTKCDKGRPPRDKRAGAAAIRIEVGGPGTCRVAELNKVLRIGITKTRPTADEQSLVLDADRVVFPLLLRNPEPGERFRPLGAPGSKKVSRFLSDKKIARHTRHRYPVLSLNSESVIICIVGIALAEDFRLRPDTRQFLKIDWTDE